MADTFEVQLPHGPRARFIDKIVEIDVENSLVTSTGHFNGDGVILERDHFPGRPIMMGALQIEAMAEDAIQLAKAMPGYENKRFVLAGVDDCIFRRPIESTEKEPEKEIIYNAAVFFSPDQKSGWACCSATVKGKLVSRAMISFMVANQK